MCNLVYVPVRNMLNRAAPVQTWHSAVFAMRRARPRAALILPNKGFYMLESSTPEHGTRIAGSVIPAICLTHETLGASSCAG